MTRSTRNGATLLGVLVVIAIIATTIALFLPATRRVHESSARTQCINNLKQVALAVHSFHDVHKQLPSATGTGSTSWGNGLTLSIHLLPFVEQAPLYKACIGGSFPSTVVIAPFLAPLDFTQSDPQRVQNFAGNVRVFTDIGIKTPFDAAVTGFNADTGTCTGTFKLTFADGTSNTIMFATRYANNTAALPGNGGITCSAYDIPLTYTSSSTIYGAYFGAATLAAAPSATSTGGWQLGPTTTQALCDLARTAHSFGTAGIQVGLGDGSVRTVAATISPFTWNVAMQPNDGNPLGSDWDF